MAVATGTATDYADLLDRLATFIAANGWSILRDTGTELIAEGEGLGGTDEIYVGIALQENPGADWYNWRLNGFTGYNSGLDFDGQPGSIAGAAAPHLPRMHLWNSAIPYWFVVSPRRMIVVAKISTVYQACHLGLVAPYLPPAALPYPLLIAGTSTASHGSRWDVQHATHSLGIMQPVCANASTTESNILENPRSSCRFWLGEWHGVQNYFNASLANITGWKSLWPYSRYSAPLFSNLRSNPADGSYALAPVVLHFTHPARHVLGEIDGVFHVTGFDNAVENIITIDTVDYLVVQNVFRNTRADYCAVRLE